MAGMFDPYQIFAGQGTGLLGNIGGFLGNNQDALLALGLGLASGQTANEGLRYGLQGLMQGRQSDRQRVAGQEFGRDLAPYITGTQAAPGGLMGLPPPGGGGPYAPAIAGIESGGRYDALGPVITKPGMYQGDQAFGKYQVMGRNIPQWTREVLGAPMTPQQFLASPQAQDAVFKAKFGQLAQRHGQNGAARAWFAGEGGMNNPNASDQLGTTVSSYAQKFNAGMGGRQGGQGLPPQITGFSGAATAPDAQGVYPSDAVMLPPGQMAQAAPLQIAPQMPQQQAPNIRNVPLQVLFKWMLNPNLGGPQREVVKELFKAQLDDAKMTEQQKNWAWARANGDTRSPADFMNPPSFGETGARDEFDRPQQGWRNPNTMTTTPAQQPGARAPIELVTKLRGEVQGLPAYKNISAASPVYQSMKEAAARDDRAADVNMIYGLAKIMDPTSVVRESEMTIAQAVATMPQHLAAMVESQFKATGRLSAPVREAIMREAHSRVSSYNRDFDQAAGQYRGIAQRYRMNLDDVIPAFGPFEPYRKAAPPPNAVEQEMKRRGLLK